MNKALSGLPPIIPVKNGLYIIFIKRFKYFYSGFPNPNRTKNTTDKDFFFA